MKLSSILNVPSSRIPPPSAHRPFGALTAERLPVTKLCRSVTVPWLALKMPPPRASVASPRLETVAPATLSATRVLVIVSVPQLAMPPPLANEHTTLGRDPSLQTRTGGPAVTRFPIIALSEIVTVAPVEKPAPMTIITPPPAAKNPAPAGDSGLESLNPPVIVIPRINTVGGSGARRSPIVITGPPPTMRVAASDTPTRLTLFVMVIPPANVPGPIRIVSPSRAASSAAWTVAKHGGRGPPTHKSARVGVRVALADDGQTASPPSVSGRLRATRVLSGDAMVAPCE